jgi:hypothetical protein
MSLRLGFVLSVCCVALGIFVCVCACWRHVRVSQMVGNWSSVTGLEFVVLCVVPGALADARWCMKGEQQVC